MRYHQYIHSIYELGLGSDIPDEISKSQFLVEKRKLLLWG